MKQATLYSTSSGLLSLDLRIPAAGYGGDISVRGHVHMMYALEGGGVPQKADEVLISCVSVTVTRGRGRGGQKVRKFCRRHMYIPP